MSVPAAPASLPTRPSAKEIGREEGERSRRRAHSLEKIARRAGSNEG